MPTVFIALFVAFVLIVALIVVLGMRLGGWKLRKGGAPRLDGGSGDSGMYH